MKNKFAAVICSMILAGCVVPQEPLTVKSPYVLVFIENRESPIRFENAVVTVADGKMTIVHVAQGNPRVAEIPMQKVAFWDRAQETIQ